MCLSLALASYSSLDRADNGGHVLELPLEYDDYFRLFDNSFNHPISSARYVEDGEEYAALDPVFTELVIRWGVNLSRKLAAASYGGQLPSGYCGFSLRPGSLQELGVVLPPLLELFEFFAEDEHPFERVLTIAEADYWLRVLRDNAMRTRDWILDAQRRSLLLGPHSRWNFDAVICNRGAGCQCYSRHDSLDKEEVRSDDARYSPSNPVLTPYHIPHSFDHRSTPSERHDSNALGLHLGVEPDAHSDSESLSYFSVTSSVDQPVRGYQPTPVDASAEITSRALIPHPVLGPGAQNALTLYQPYPALSGTSDPRSSEVFRSPPSRPSLSPSPPTPSDELSPRDDGQQEPHGLGSPKYHLAKRFQDSLLHGDPDGARLDQLAQDRD